MKSTSLLTGIALAAMPWVAVNAADTHLYWGDTHLHTSYSIDAYATGNNVTDPDTAFRYARGLPVLHPVTREKIRIERPLDFLVVADHAELLQLQVRLDEEDPDMLATPTGKRLAELHKQNKRAVWNEVGKTNQGEGKELLVDLASDRILGDAWQRQVKFADDNNIPGKFTALIGWEWSSAPNWSNLHRVVFTSADGATAAKFLPFSSYRSQRPEDLWAFLDKTSRETGAQFVAIPHNSNMSDGRMFDRVDSDGRPITAEYARERIRWEGVMEISQTKGTSETDPVMSPNDEFAGFEVRNKLLTGTAIKSAPGSFARTALMEGLAQEARIGVNPFKFGIIGSTDSHNSLTSVEEYNFYGKLANQMIAAQRPQDRGNFPIWELSAAGLAGVWATGNTRQGIFEAFKRKEVYGTSGPRIALRVFGGFAFRAADAKASDIAAVGYRRGVPMGADLTAAPRGKAPSFLVHAVKDERSGNLDRLQMIKGWLDSAGARHEKVYDIAWSGNRRPDAQGKLPAVGNTVDVKTASYRNDVGAAQLATVWTDPEFDPKQRAFYYVRVLEIPTPRQSLYDAVALGIDPAQTKAPTTLQERAWSSPIWYTP
ncbi:MAG: DUF3604 domain-containing protein [Steroidobacteraceae bacterium]